MQCSFGAIRQGSGRAEVHLTPAGYDAKLHKDQIRVLRFAPTSVTSADPEEKVTFERRGDNWDVTVNGFYYDTIPDAVIVGASSRGWPDAPGAGGRRPFARRR